MKQAALVAGKGFCMGAADIVPGVSGGTMALILGIYPRLLGAIRAVDLALFRLVGRGRLVAAARHVDALFLLLLGAGIAGALVFFTRVIGLPQLIATHPQPVYSVFFGLILMSLCILLRQVADWRLQDAAWILAGTLAGLALALAVPVDAPQSARFLFASGAAAACAMILPASPAPSCCSSSTSTRESSRRWHGSTSRCWRPWPSAPYAAWCSGAAPSCGACTASGAPPCS